MERTPEEITEYLASRNQAGYKALISDVFNTHFNKRFAKDKLDITPETYEKLEKLEGVGVFILINDSDELISTVCERQHQDMRRVITYRYSLLDPSGQVRRAHNRGWTVPELQISTERYRQLPRRFLELASYSSKLKLIFNNLR